MNKLRDVSNVIVITVSPELKGGTLSAAQTITYNTAPSPLSVSGVTGGNCNAYNYTWQQSTNGTDYTNITTTTASTYTPAKLIASTYYRVVVSCASGDVPVTTNAVLITVAAQLKAGSITPLSQTITFNTKPSPLTALPSSGGNCSGVYSYQWQQASTVNGVYTNIINATSLTYAPPALTTNTYYRLRTLCGNNDSVFSNSTVIVSALQPLEGGCITSAEQTIVSGATPATIIASEAANGNCSASYSYQWQSSPDGVYFKDVSGATSANLNFSSGLTQTTYYQRRVTCGSVILYTGSIKITVTGSASIRQMIRMDPSQPYNWWVVTRFSGKGLRDK